MGNRLLVMSDLDQGLDGQEWRYTCLLFTRFANVEREFKSVSRPFDRTVVMPVAAVRASTRRDTLHARTAVPHPSPHHPSHGKR